MPLACVMHFTQKQQIHFILTRLFGQHAKIINVIYIRNSLPAYVNIIYITFDCHLFSFRPLSMKTKKAFALMGTACIQSCKTVS